MEDWMRWVVGVGAGIIVIRLIFIFRKMYNGWGERSRKHV